MKILSYFIKPFDRFIDGEKPLYIMRRHPWLHFILSMKAFLTFSIPITITLLAVIYSNFFINIIGTIGYFITISILFLIVYTAFFIRISTIFIDYKYDNLIITNKRIIAVDQNFLFKREIDSIYIKDIINMCAYRTGFWETMFQFGELDIKTAAETKDFLVKYLPNPNNVIQIIQNQQQLLRNQKYDIGKIELPDEPTILPIKPEESIRERMKEAFQDKFENTFNK